MSRLPLRRLPGRALPLLAALLVALPAARLAHAEVWAYVDDAGRTHFAREQVDARYQLFFKGPSSLDPPPVAATPAVPDVRGTALYARVATNPNVQRLKPLVERHARERALDPALVKAVIAVESAFDPDGISSKGAVGLMQVLPATGERYGLAPDARRSVADKLKDPATNVRIGTRYLADLLQRYDNDLPLALAAYNAGEGAVDRHEGQVPPYPETQDYVRLVQAFHALYSPPAASPSPPARVTIPRRRGAT